MSRFLANLVAKNAGSAIGVRPWLPTHFEPAAPVVLTPVETFEERTETRPAPPPDPAAPHTAASDPRPQQLPAAPAPERLRAEPSRETAVGSPITQTVIKERAVEKPVFVERFIQTQPSPSLRNVVPERVAITTEMRPAAVLQYAEARPPSTLLISETHVDIHDTVQSPEAAAGPRTARPDSTSAPPLNPRAARIAIPPSQPAPLRTEPDVHITIGRVEIRAVTPAQPAAQRRSVPQPMSLEEYQRQRTSGGSR